mgnify:FL=1
MSTFLLFQLASLLLAIVSIRVLVTTARNRRALFDETLTPGDRQQLSEAAFFLLLPLGVLLHELGHVVAVWLAGGQVVGFGFLFFLGWVEHTGSYTPAELYWIALAGNLVSLGLGLAALALALVGPFGRAVNWLLLVFGGLELGTTLVFYPLLDLVSDLHGDWATIYRAGTPLLSGVTALLHAGLVVTGLILWQSGRFRRLVEARTGIRWPRRLTAGQRRALAWNLAEAAERVAGSWGGPVEAVTGVGPDHAGVALRWESGGLRRRIEALVAPESGVLELRAELDGPARPGARLRQRLGALDRPLPPEDLARILTRLMEMVDRWPAPTAVEQAGDG